MVNYQEGFVFKLSSKVNIETFVLEEDCYSPIFANLIEVVSEKGSENEKCSKSGAVSTIPEVSKDLPSEVIDHFVRLNLQEADCKNRVILEKFNWNSKITEIFEKYDICEKHANWRDWQKVVRGPTPVDILKEIFKSLQGYFLFFKIQNSNKVRFQVHPLHVAAFMGNFVLFKHVLDRTGDIYAKNRNGWNALHFAVLRHVLKNNRGAHYFLGREKEMPIISLMDTIGYNKVLPDIEICPEVAALKYKNQPKSLEKYKEMKSHLSYEHSEIVEMILEKISKIYSKNPADNEGWTPLHLAAYRGQVDICQKIIEKSKYTHMPSTNEISSPLQWACLKGHVEVVNLILDKTNQVNPKIDRDQNTILHFAIEVGNLKIVIMLLEKMHEPWKTTVANGKGISPFHLAMAKLRGNNNLAQFEICQLLWYKLDQQYQFDMLDKKKWDGTSKENLKHDLLEFKTDFNPEKDFARLDFFCEIIRFAEDWVQNLKLPHSPYKP